MNKVMVLTAVLAATAAHAVQAQELAQEQAPAPTQDASDPATFCATDITPVIGLDYGSRYTDDSATRSDFDETSDAEVTKQLAPVDKMITFLSNIANIAAVPGPDQEQAAACVLSRLHEWAADYALSEIGTMNAKISVPSRIAGFAFAYRQVEPFLPVSEERTVVEAWLSKRSYETISFFDLEAPPKASRNNLRAWAAMSSALVGISTDDPLLKRWAADSTELVACSAAEDGSLPMEMGRGALALHYQLHAVSALVVTAALLDDQGFKLFDRCGGNIGKAVDFVVEGFADPAAVTALAGKEQSYFNGKEKLEGFEVAWAAAYLAKVDDPAVRKFVEPFGKLMNSKIGGDQALIWPDKAS